MVLTALRGAVGFLTRIPVGHDGAAWEAFQRTPAAFPAVGYLVGGLAALPLLLVDVLPSSTVAALAVVWLYALTGITHLDGVADLGDAAVVHGDTDQRVEVLKDTVLGVGGTAALGVVLLAVGFGFLGLAATPIRIAVAVVVASEVGAKLSMAGVAGLGTARHEGLGSAFTSASGPSSLLSAVLVALPAGVLAWPSAVAAAALVGAVAGGALVSWWANGLVGGVNGDVFGAANELGRLAALHAGVMVWWLF